MRHGARWLLALALTVTAAASAADHWAPEEITDKFDEVDKKLRDLRHLESKDKTTTRRVIAIEAGVRDLRTAVKALEMRLQTMDAALKAIRADLAAVRKTADGAVTAAAEATAAARPKPTTRITPAHTGPVAEIIDEEEKKANGFRTLTGTVVNRTSQALTFVVVQAMFVDDNGHVVRTESAYTSPRVIPPKGRSAFRIHIRDDGRIRRFRLSLQAR